MEEMTDEAVRKEYRTLMRATLKAEGGCADDAFKRVKATERGALVAAELAKRKLPGYGHEDGRFDYTCPAWEYCRCGQ